MLFVSVRQLIPEDLAGIAPGPELARVLAGLELSRCRVLIVWRSSRPSIGKPITNGPG